MPTKIKSRIFLLAAGFLFGALFYFAPSAAAACDALPSDKGQVANSFGVESPGNYNLWLRVWAPNDSANSLFVRVDDQCAVVAGDGQSTDKDFTWVNYQADDNSKKLSFDLGAGNHTVTFAGREANAGVDRALLLASDCVPEGMGDNCLTDTSGGGTTGPVFSRVHQSGQTQQRSATQLVVVSACAFVVLGALGFLGWKYRSFIKRLPIQGVEDELGVVVGGALHAGASVRVKLSHFLRIHRLSVALGMVVIVLATVIGVVAALDSPSAFEAENGQVSGNAKVIDSSLASAHKFVRFEAAAAANASGSSTGGGSQGGSHSSGGGQQSGGGGSTSGGGGGAVSSWPSAYNTGYPHGLSGDTRTPVGLSTYSGPCTITAANTVIDSKDISCRLIIRTSGVVIKNSRIRVANEGAVYVDDVYHAVIMDTELDGQRQDNSAGGISLAGDGSYTLLRVNAHSSGDIARANWGGVAIVDSWLHDNYCLQSSCHNDTVQSTGWTDSCTASVEGLGPVAGSTDTTSGKYCIRIVHSRLENQNNQTSNILLKADQGAIHDVLVENNLFNGGGYTFYWYDANYQISNGVVRNNRFRRASSGTCSGGVSPNLGDTSVPATAGYWPNSGCYGPVASNVGDSSRYPTWTNNVWDDTGAAISF